MNLKGIESIKWDIIRLSDETVIDAFDCGDDDLNNFLIEDAKNYLADSFCFTSKKLMQKPCKQQVVVL